jgi:hypothetical protein
MRRNIPITGPGSMVRQFAANGHNLLTVRRLPLKRMI